MLTFADKLKLSSQQELEMHNGSEIIWTLERFAERRSEPSSVLVRLSYLYEGTENIRLQSQSSEGPRSSPLLPFVSTLSNGIKMVGSSPKGKSNKLLLGF